MGVLFFLNDQTPKSPRPNQTKPIPPASTLTTTKLFNPSEINQIIWSESDKIISLKKTGEKWEELHKQFSPDAWAVQRRLQLLSEGQFTSSCPALKPVGTVKLSSAKTTLSGEFDLANFCWTVGPAQGKSLTLNHSPGLQTLLAEGLMGFKSHVLNLCGKSDSLQALDFQSWSVEKQNGNWVVLDGAKREPVRPDALHGLEITLCSLHAENFVKSVIPNEAKPVLKLTFGEKRKPLMIKQAGVTFYADNLPGFQSQALLEILKSTHAADLKDPVLNDATIALDHSRDQNDRLAAIRRMKTSTSPQAIAALKEILFEKTEIDLYRYEAVDSLASIGTKEAFKIMNERLEQAGRSGFELRMARALSAAMGRFFRSDEKTPGQDRRPEVDELIKAVKDNPPGK